MGRLDDKVAVITGAASGMGRATAVRFAGEGASVVIADINREGGESAATACKEAGGTAHFEYTDVTREEDIARVVALAVERFGTLDVMFNNAGAGGTPALEDTTVEAWDFAHAIILRSAFLGMKHAVPEMRRNGGGSIISTASDAGIRALPGTHAYSTFKAGVMKLTESVAQVVGPEGIRVNAIAPGWIVTPLLASSFPGGIETLERVAEQAQPVKRAGRPEDIASAALYLASDESSFVTGITLPVDGGWLVQVFQNPAVDAALARAAEERPAWME